MDELGKALSEVKTWLDGMPWPLWQVGLAVLAVVLSVALIRAWRSGK